jgi:hypothetical protein
MKFGHSYRVPPGARLNGVKTDLHDLNQRSHPASRLINFCGAFVPDEIEIVQSISIREAGYDEYWLQD